MSSLSAPFQPLSLRCFVLLPQRLLRKPVMTPCRFSCSSLCAYLLTVAHFYRHFNIIDTILRNSGPAKARSISLAVLLKPTYAAAYLSMNTDQPIFLFFPLRPLYDFSFVANGDGAGMASQYVLILQMSPRRSCNRGCTRYDTPDNDTLP